ncbi:thermonuclease family protein [Thermomicrobium sp.]
MPRWIVLLTLLLVACRAEPSTPPIAPHDQPTGVLTPVAPPRLAATATATPARAARVPATVTPAIAGETAQVVTVIDGDTLTVRTARGEAVVRLIGIDAPERGNAAGQPAECYFEEATAMLRLLTSPGTIVILERDVSETDRYGRLLRYVWVEQGGRWLLVNEELVRRGAAVARRYAPDVRYADRLEAAQRQAQRERRGLWEACTAPSQAPTSLPAPSSRSGCDPSYPDLCLPPPPPDLDCRDIPQRRFRVLPPDPHRLDADGDGIGCESG